MTTIKFAELLESPSQLSTMSYESLDNLLLQYPYCNNIRMLLLKKYKNDKHIAFEKHLTLASMYASDRGKLYEFLNAATVVRPTIDKMAADKPKLSEEKKTKLATQLVEPPPVYHFKISQNPPVLAFQKPLTVEDLFLGESDSDTNSLTEDDRGLSTMPIEEWLQEFEPPRIEERERGTSYKKGFKLSRIPVFEKSMFDFLEEDIEEVKKETKSSKTKKKKIASKLSKELTSPKKESELSQEVVDDNILDKLEVSDEMKSEEIDVFDLFLSQTDGFLKSIQGKKEKKEVDNEEAWEDDSIDEKDEVLSETLAGILAKQGQKEKAIKMYETLSLNFPKKSSFFAEEINKLRN